MGKEIGRVRHDLFMQFLDATNRKEGLFRDIIIESDYDPLQNRDKAIKYHFDDSDDPVKHDLHKMMRERTAMNDEKAFAKELKAKFKTMLPAKVWDTVEVTSFNDNVAQAEMKPKPDHAIARKFT